MESKQVIYSNGHIYDKQTDKRLKIKNEGEILMSAVTGVISDADPVGELPKKIATTEEQEISIKKIPRVAEYKKVFDRGKLLYFCISRKDIDYEFQVELLEDLYFYLLKSNEDKEGKLYSCACVVRKNTTGNIKRFEEVNGRSLNEIHKITFVHYFGNKGNPSSNAIDRFYEESQKEDSTTIARHRKF
jgi:hypothetical protein